MVVATEEKKNMGCGMAWGGKKPRGSSCGYKEHKAEEAIREREREEEKKGKVV